MTTIPFSLSGGQTGKVVEELCELLQDLVTHVHEAIGCGRKPTSRRRVPSIKFL